MTAINRPHRDDQIQMAQFFVIRVKQIREEAETLYRDMHYYLDTSKVCADIHGSIHTLMAGLDDVDTDIDKALDDSSISDYKTFEEELAVESEVLEEARYLDKVRQDYYASVL